jgi:hypothetical protein
MRSVLPLPARTFLQQKGGVQAKINVLTGRQPDHDMNPQLKQKLNIIEPLNFTEMKKISKLVINPEKLLKNDELLILRGGYDEGCAYRDCSSNNDCCPLNPNCIVPPNWPGARKQCYS